MNALLISPEFPDTFWNLRHAVRLIGKKAGMPPLGLLTVAAMLPADWNKRLVDVNVRGLTREDLAWADCALIGAMTVQRTSAREIIDRCKDAGVRAVAGGPLFTSEPEQFARVDHLVLNEAELTLPPFLQDLEQGRAKRVYSTAEFADMTLTPAPDWSLIDPSDYVAMPVQYSRGCPFACDFCEVPTLFGHRPRTKSAAQVIGELDRLAELGWHGEVIFADDNLIGNKKEVKTELVPALLEWARGKEGLPFATQLSMNLVDDEELMAMMVAAGFGTVFVGIETPEEPKLAGCGKKQNLHRDLMSDVKHMQAAGLQVHGGFIVGFDTDTPETFERLAQFIQASGIAVATVSLLNAPRGTRLYERMKQAGRLAEGLTGDTADGTTNIVPVMDFDVLHNGYKNLLAHLYAPDVYYERVRTFLRQYRPARTGRSLRPKDMWQYLPAFLRSAWRLGIVEEGRAQFWKLLSLTLARHRRAFPAAVMLAYYGYHFRQVSDHMAALLYT